jgi:hypothetical protein
LCLRWDAERVKSRTDDTGASTRRLALNVSWRRRPRLLPPAAVIDTAWSGVLVPAPFRSRWSEGPAEQALSVLRGLVTLVNIVAFTHTTMLLGHPPRFDAFTVTERRICRRPADDVTVLLDKPSFAWREGQATTETIESCRNSIDAQQLVERARAEAWTWCARAGC